MKIPAENVELYERLSKILMAWALCLFSLFFLAVFLVAFLWCIFTHQDKSASLVSGAIDLILLTAFRAMIKFHFPDTPKQIVAGSTQVPRLD